MKNLLRELLRETILFVWHGGYSCGQADGKEGTGRTVLAERYADGAVDNIIEAFCDRLRELIQLMEYNG